MTFHRPHNYAARWLPLLLALTLSAATSVAQNVGGFIIAKVQNFQQTSTAAPISDPVQPFQFGSLITMGTATINSAVVTFSGTASPRSYSPLGTGDFSILDTFTTQAQLDAAYQNGQYNLSINTSAGTFSRSIFLLPFSYPTTPVLTVPASNWQSSMVVIDPTVDYNLTWSPFSNAQVTDAIELIVGVLTFGPFPPTQTSFTLPAGSLVPGIIYPCDLAFLRVVGTAAGDQNIGPGYAFLAKDTEFALRAQAPAFALTAAVSRKSHGKVGSFDVDLPLSGTPGIECRTGAVSGDHTIVVTFTNNVVSGNAAVTSGIASIAGAPVFGNNTMTIGLTGVANAQTVTLTLSNVIDQFAQTLPDTNVTAAFLLGDTNGNGAVNASDVSQTKGQLGQDVTSTNFRADVNTNGAINAGDVSQIKSLLGTGLP